VRLNVRCCCQPKKILGTLEVPDGVLEARRELAIRLGPYPCLSESHAAPFDQQPKPVDFEFVKLRVFSPGHGAPPELAVYSDDRPVEFWRGVQGFEEA